MFPLKDDNPTYGPTPVTVALIIICAIIFLLQLADVRGHGLVYSFGLIPGVLLGSHELDPEITAIPAFLTPLTSMFLHGGWMHLIGNMLFLWIFGNNIEDVYGGARFLVFYILCGLAAAAAQIAQDPNSTIPMIGASGAISGVLGAYMRFFPRAQVVTLVILVVFVTTVRIRAFWFLGIWFAMQAVSGLATPPGEGGVAWWAHVGGFIAGYGLSFVFPRKRRTRRVGPWG